MAGFEYRQAEEIRDSLAKHGVRYLFIGKAGAVLLGFPDTTQDADLFVDRSRENGHALVAALCDLGFALNDQQTVEIQRGKDFIQLKNGPLTWTWCMRRMASSGSRTRGVDTSRWKAFPCVIWTTSSRARRLPAAAKTWKRSRAFREYWLKNN